MAIATRWKAASKKELSKILEAMVSGPGYMRNPNPKRAKMSFLSHNRHEIVFWDPKCRIPFLATQNVLLLPGSKSGMRPFQGHNHCHRTWRPFGIVIHSRCQETKKWKESGTTQKGFEILYEAFTSTPTSDKNLSTVYQTVQPAWKMGQVHRCDIHSDNTHSGMPKNVHNKHHRIISRWLQGSSSSPMFIDFHCNLYNLFFDCAFLSKFCSCATLRLLEWLRFITVRIPIKADETVRVEPTTRNNCSHSGRCPLWSSVLCRFSWNRCPR